MLRVALPAQQGHGTQSSPLSLLPLLIYQAAYTVTHSDPETQREEEHVPGHAEIHKAVTVTAHGMPPLPRPVPLEGLLFLHSEELMS